MAIEYSRFKLIKPYPGSIELGNIIYPILGLNNILTGFSNIEGGNHTGWTIHPSQVVNYPEFWQPENEWEVISKFSHSPIGSTHWLNSILSEVMNVGTMMQKERRINSAEFPFDRHRVDWGKYLSEGSKEIMEYFKDRLK